MTPPDRHALRNEFEAVFLAVDRPTPSMWGMEFYGDAPAAVGGGTGCFIWLESRDALLDFAARVLTYANAGPSNVDHEEVARRCATIVAQVRDGSLGLPEGMEAVNAALTGFSQLRWWGRFEELLTGDGAFPRCIRAWSRGTDSEDEDADTSPIRPDEREEFVATLPEYGL